MKKYLVVLIILFLTMSVFAASKKDIPKNVKIIYQVAGQNTISTTVIDLENNEIVIITYQYDGMLGGVIRTGWIVNPNEYQTISGTKE
ncbi:MAG: hypothetical protein A2Y34_06165 [Spirochaetes bacterium GWC1_27_15]|nr:MAG: hypothetical protein A2Z98_01080 [Spirochaetes bacterium GWB1_27_13]OHD22284.1 MAG: hypothetical protein A2Y34_06165 [Spirochaetes bacterium GWC1_27_15]